MKIIKNKLKLKMICLILFSILLFVNIQSAEALQNINTKPVNDRSQCFTQCYVEINGILHNDWPAVIKLPNHYWFFHHQKNNEFFILYGYILFESETEITIYDSKDGAVLWKYDSDIDPLVSFIGFQGAYTFTDNIPYLPQISYQGEVLFVHIQLKNYG
jgi:hypothetical protein